MRRQPTASQRTVLTVGAVVMGIGAVAAVRLRAADRAAGRPGVPRRRSSSEYIRLFRVMCGTTVIFAVSFTIGEMLLARQRFLAYGIAPLLYNTGIVLGAVVLGPRMGIMGVAVGTVIGAFLHLGVRLVGIRAHGRQPAPAAGARGPAPLSASTCASRSPRCSASPSNRSRSCGSPRRRPAIVAGGVSAVSFARNFQSVPVSIVGIAFATAVFPVLSDRGRGRRPARGSCGSWAPTRSPSRSSRPPARRPAGLLSTQRHRACSWAAARSTPRTSR